MRPNETSMIEELALGSDRDLRRRFMVIDETLPGNLRFGLTLEVLDKLAEETALAYVRRFQPEARVVTAAIDSIRVRNPADVLRDLRFLSRVNYVGRTSLEVGIRVEQDGHPPRHIASCYFTMVARLGEQSIAIPALDYLDELELRRERRAVERRQKVQRQEKEALEPPTREEFDMLTRLHRQQDSPDFDGLLAGKLNAESWERVYLEQENVPRKIFGGYLMHRAFQLASIHSEKIASQRPVVVAVNRINFLRPVRIGDTLHFTSRIVYTGRTSIAVETRIERMGWEKSVGDLSNNCVFTFVNVDDQLRPQPVPTIFPCTYDEDARYLAAHRRNRARARYKESIWSAAAMVQPGRSFTGVSG
jgi:acyl-coenzyme A thioesterase 9